MGTRFHQLGIQSFNARIPGPSPTPSDRAKFLSPKITNERVSERAIGIELSKTIRSVLEAAEPSGLRVLHTPSHKAKRDHSQRSDTVNDIGIYLDTEAARRVTTLTSQDVVNTRLTEEDLASGDFGRRSWYHMAALGQIKSFNNDECAFYMIPDSERPERRRKTKKRKGTQADDGASEESQPTATTDDTADTADASEDETVPLDPPPTEILDGNPYIKKGPQPESGLGQLGDYMYNLSAFQHRLFSYGFYVQWRWARLLYFDRTGALISEPFDWTETSSPLHDFVWKFAHMTPEQRGYDPTAQEASYNEMQEVLAAANADSIPEAIRPYIKKAILSNDKEADHSRRDGHEWDADEAPIYKLIVTSSAPSPDDIFPDSQANPPPTDGPQTSERTFLVGRPHFVADSPIGRCTRGYIAWDVSERRFCFLKDSWRPVVPGRARPEHLVYERLHSARVARITTLVCGGDVGGPQKQRTVTHDCFPEQKRPVLRVHYRIVTQEIGGYLIDWDLSRLRSELENGPVEPDRTGTWQFRSALSLAYPRKPYRLADDIESFVHTYRWLVLRFHKTLLRDLRSFVRSEYESSSQTVITGIRVGGQHKLRSFVASPSLIQVEDNDNLQGILDALARTCFLHYQLINKSRMEALYGVPEKSSKENTKPAGAATAKGPYDDTDVADAVARIEQGLSDFDDPFNVPPQASNAGVNDPCDVVGPLSSYTALHQIFRQGIHNDGLRQADQFRLRSAEEPADVVLNVSSQNISSMSQSQTVDSVSSAPGKKRRQGDEDGDDVGTSAQGADATGNGECSTEAQVAKRQKKTRAKVY